MSPMGGTGDATHRRRLAVGPMAVLLGVLAVFVLVHMGTTHDLAVGERAAAHTHQGVPAHLHQGEDLFAAVPSAVRLVTGAPFGHGEAPPTGGHHNDVLVGCLVALTGLVGSLLLRPRLLAGLSWVLERAAGVGLAPVASRALRAPPAPGLATLCILRT